jgi:hypothetical protein
MHGPTCIFWANLTPFSLQTAAQQAAAQPRVQAAAAAALGTPGRTPKKISALMQYGRGVGVPLGLGRIVTVCHRSSTLYRIH